MIEVTHRCPCDCVHCLLVREPHDELTARRSSTDILRQLRDEGVFNLGLTGGEPFARRDFPQILDAAHAHRFFLSVLTTGVTVGARRGGPACGAAACGAWRSRCWAPGRTRTTRIMRLRGAFARTVAAVKLLVAAGLEVNLKTTVLTLNWREVPAMRDLAPQLGAGFEANVTVAPRIDGDRGPLDFALTAAELAQLDPGPDQRRPDPRRGPHRRRAPGLHGRPHRGHHRPPRRGLPLPALPLRAGQPARSAPCTTSCTGRPIRSWCELRQLEDHEVSACAGCDLRGQLPALPGIAYLETGDVRAPSPSACALARHLAHIRKND